MTGGEEANGRKMRGDKEEEEEEEEDKETEKEEEGFINITVTPTINITVTPTLTKKSLPFIKRGLIRFTVIQLKQTANLKSSNRVG
jgi:hypothetical protein